MATRVWILHLALASLASNDGLNEEDSTSSMKARTVPKKTGTSQSDFSCWVDCRLPRDLVGVTVWK